MIDILRYSFFFFLFLCFHHRANVSYASRGSLKLKFVINLFLNKKKKLLLLYQIHLFKKNII